MASSTSSTAGSLRRNEPPPVSFDALDNNPTPSFCLCVNKKPTVQLVSWTNKNPARRFTICPNRYLHTEDKCNLYQWNDPEISNDFLKHVVCKLRDKVWRLQEQVAEKGELLRWKDMMMLSEMEMGTNLQTEVAGKDALLRGKDDLLHKEEKEVKEKEKKVKKVKKICWFPMSVVIFSFVIACWCYHVNDSPSLM